MSDQENFYIINDTEAQTEYVSSRKAEKWLSFLIPHLKKGDRVLDCGCGVGSLTLDVAERVFPGEVIGVDMDEAQLETARNSARERGITNVTFQKADVNNLPFEKESFDAVYAHTLLFHLNNQQEIIDSFHALLKAGGVVGVADDDWGSAVGGPEHPLADKTLKLMAQVIQQKGGNPYYSRNLRALLHRAGFVNNEGFALANEYYGNDQSFRAVTQVTTSILRSQDFMSTVTDNGWATAQEIEDLIEYNRVWSESPDSFHAHLYCAGIGWKAQ